MATKIDTKTRHITPAGGNIFADLGFEPTEAAALLARSKADIARTKALKTQLMEEITRWMEESGNKQLEAAKLMHVSRPRVSDVVNQKTEKFTLDSLIGMLGHIGKSVSLVVK